MTISNTRRLFNVAARTKAIKQMRQPTWKERIDDATQSAPYGIRWGKSVKGSSTHIMEYNKYSRQFNARCNKTNNAVMYNANVYLKAKVCYSCSLYLFGSTGLHKAYEQDWEHYTNPATGRTKRERHN